MSLKFALYALLGVAPGATEAEIKRAYRKLAKRLHPDVGGDPAKFAEISSAHEILTDPARRAHYDLTGDDLPKKPPDEVQAKAQDLLRDLIGHLLRDCGDDITSAPLISLMRDHLKKTQKEVADRITKLKQIKARAERAAPRFKRKGDGDNVIGALMRSHIEMAQKSIDGNEAGKPVIQRALDLLTDHTFDPELLLADRAYAQQSAATAGGATLGSIFGFRGAFGT